MQNDWHHHNVQLSRQQMISLVINHKSIETVTGEGENIKISEPSSTIYDHDKETKVTEYTIFCKLMLNKNSYLGKLKIVTKDNKSYQGTASFQEY